MDAELLADICKNLAEGKSLRAICRDMGLAESTVRYWLLKDGDASAQYARACELRADCLFDQVLEIADDTTMSADDRRIAIDARKWAAGKMNGKYSDKVKHVGGDASDPPIRTDNRITLDVSGLTDDQRRALASIRIHSD